MSGRHEPQSRPHAAARGDSPWKLLCIAALASGLGLSACAGNPERPDSAAAGSLGPRDDTAYIQGLLDEDSSEIVIPKGDGPWLTGPLFLTAARDKRIVFEEGCEIAALRGRFKDTGDCLLSLEKCTNVTLSGYGAALTMNRKDYAGPDYRKGEWRHCISVLDSSSVLIEGLTIAKSGGDGVYVGQRRGEPACAGITLRNLRLEDHYRQGVSVIAARDFLMEGCLVTGTGGTPPSAGIDFEPNSGTDGFINCLVRDCLFEKNRGPGIIVYPVKLKGSGRPVDIRFERCVSRRNLLSVSMYGISPDISGSIAFVDCDLSFPSWIHGGKNLSVMRTKNKGRP